jgi:predicted transcriptional regulator
MPFKLESPPNVIEACYVIIDQLKKVREKKGITSYKLAELTGIRQPNIIRMETFEAIPNLETIVKVCETLDVELVVRTKKKKPAEDQQVNE